MIVAIIALVVSLGGVTYAATQIGTKQLKNGAVTTKKLRTGAVTSAKTRNNNLTGRDIREASLGFVPGALQAANSASLGGIPAAAHVSGLSYEEEATPSDSQTFKVVNVECDPGQQVVGGGGDIEGPNDVNLVITDTRPGGANDTLWSVRAVETDAVAANWSLRGFAICVNG
jgi:hypothetical protein